MTVDVKIRCDFLSVVIAYVVELEGKARNWEFCKGARLHEV